MNNTDNSYLNLKSNNTLQLLPNFVHIVYFWLNHPENKLDREKFEKSLAKFIHNSKYAKTKFVGIPAMTDREVSDNSYTYSLIMSFDSKKEQDKYQTEEAHRIFEQEAQHLWSKVLVFDSLGI